MAINTADVPRQRPWSKATLVDVDIYDRPTPMSKLFDEPDLRFRPISYKNQIGASRLEMGPVGCDGSITCGMLSCRRIQIARRRCYVDF